jgi:hypothetical protein
MGHVGEAVRRSEALELLELDPFQEPGAGWAVFGMVREVIYERIGIEENRVAVLEIIEDHGDSKMPKSGSRARRSRVSTSPVHGTIPAVCLARLIAGWSVTMTLSCSARGNG